MTRDLREIAALYAERKNERGPLIGRMEEVRQAYNGDLNLPVSERVRNEKPAAANLIQLGIDATAQRIASTQADLQFPVARPGMKTHEQKARERRKAALGWAERSSMALIDARRARHLITYACSPVAVRPEFTRLEMPYWDVLDPLCTYPAPQQRCDEMVPEDVIFTYTRSLKWLRAAYGDKVAFLPPARTTNDGPYGGNHTHPQVHMVEYIDAEKIVLVATGRGEGSCGPITDNAYAYSAPAPNGSFGWGAEVLRLENKAGRCLVAIPGRVTLDRLMGQFDQMIPKFVAQARLAALEMLAIEEGIFPDQWIVSNGPNTKASVITYANGREGIVGEIENGTVVTIAKNPGYKTDQYQARLERDQRIEGGVPAQMGGETPHNVRTGRAGDGVLAAAIDFPIAEHQKIIAASKQAEFEIAIEVAKGWAGNKTVSFNTDWPGARGSVTYKANELFDADYPCRVRFSMAGADLNAQVVRTGQKLGAGLISTQTGREMDPEIEDPELEHDRTVSETLERAMLDAIATQANSGQLPPADVAWIMQQVRTDKMDLAEAVMAAQERAQERQAVSGEPGTPAGPVDPMSPQAQPGLALPGAGAEAGVAVPEPGAGPTNITQVLNQARVARSSIMAKQPA